MAPVLRGITGTLVLIVGLLIAAACTPAAAPTPVAAPTQPAPAPAAKPAEAIPAAKPAATAAPKPAPTPTGEPAWKAEWDKVVADAKKEGKVAVKGTAGAGWRNAAMEFQKAYPDIKLEFTGALGRDINPRILAERQAGQYLWDVYSSGAADLYGLTPHSALAPFRAAVILPEVLDDSKWRGGFGDGFLDLAGRHIYRAHLYLSPSVFVNREVVPESELRTLDDLLDPKWKGKIAWQDPRVAGAGQFHASNLLAAKGEDYLRKLLAQDIVPLTDTRMLVETLIRGRYPIAIGTRPDEREEFTQAGLFGHIKILDPDNPASAAAGGASGHIGLMDGAPNPNAAKVFINWFLSKEGQKIHVEQTAVNSRRLDVDGPPETAPRPGVNYVSLDSEENLPMRNRAAEIARGILK